MFLSLKTLYRKRTVIWPFYFYTIIRTLSKKYSPNSTYKIYLAMFGLDRHIINDENSRM
ncbi:penicillin-binding transpeptidase domain-containing protein, partial [Staphylococcus aureus]|uniref:penicillin-binding transpeptidase domain-containing protein n=1 Tax=Staphylococcus aureus TaxID=1280 RepID=UPI0021AA670B